MTTNYDILNAQAKSLVEGETDLIANMANISALLFNNMTDLNWAGFYRVVNNELVLGPFQGQPACIRIGMGKGVCGTAALRRETMVVEDVHQFDGHIACDAASNSEIVIPIILNEAVIGVLDIDSPVFSRFNQKDAKGLQGIVDALVDSIK
ncbi:GAF domain-containing protein [Alteromonas facilis]|uniref:GAF domain-containing protein n=1 Tax=Alteromonas facilis TaxID=2048004 RepID=UPI000C28CD16|nr:GAF domain-containing protein [Alteromonas facilis]